MGKQPNENEVVTGGLLDSTIEGGEIPSTEQAPATESVENQTPDQSAASPAPTQEAPVFLGGRRFDSQAHLEAYLAQLERQAVSNTGTTTQAQTPQVDEENFDFATEFYNDPNKAAKVLQDRIYKKAMTDFEKKQAAVAAWSEFFRQNPDLQKHREMVEFQYQKHRSSIDSQPLDRAFVDLATKTRTYLAQIRGEPTGNGSEVPRTQVVSTGASGNVAPAKPAAQTPQIVNFMDQVRNMQQKRRAK